MKCLKWCFIDSDLFASPSTLVACANIESFNMKLEQTCSAFLSFSVLNTSNERTTVFLNHVSPVDPATGSRGSML